ncbi:MAG TPA: ABC transporter ATP-binding protein [Acidimicrobiales bacterium]
MAATTLPAPPAADPVDPLHPGRPAVEVDGLVKTYGRTTVLDGLSFAVPQGEIFGLLGANGAGKTTAVEIVQGLRSRDAGEVRVLGLDPVADRPRLRHLVGSQLQSSALPDRLKVGEALRLFARLAGDVVDWAQLRDEWSLGHLERRPFGALSGGERQRLFLALALVNRPRLVFLDELTQGLDVGARRDTWALIERVRDAGSTVVLVTHFMDEAERLCDRVAVLHRGRITAAGRPADLVADHGGPVHLRFSLPDEVPADVLAGVDRVPGVTAATTGAAGAVDGRRVDIAATATATVAVTAELARRGLAPADFTVVRPSLEDVFVALTREVS